ncbi:succinylglutamate desuccinylase/aspartoacylase family protein [Clostridium cochlearium]|uniref:succinylglutamate desuccinylase/aspartoacylase family protein n=2 Tax=Clostridium cochlearium TaxID=1494 RepID=UPI001C0EF882|nr:succinylglutamate desuccinylase/aspartoacylase family protein [Clostridium cochlearium]MBU5269912.1 succinylglutamate desuccinylase/aspartoacylase family protein [Clostridium cochlearium]
MRINKIKKYKIAILIMILIMIFKGVNSTKEETITKKMIMKGTELETESYIIDSGKKGESIFIISGIHGNEIASIEASKISKKRQIKKGKLIIISKANIDACNKKVRNPYYMQDLNRIFPGRTNGTGSEKLAYEIFNLIKKERPKIVLDLHEWEENSIGDEKKFSYAMIFNNLNKENLEVFMYLLDQVKRNDEYKDKFTFLNSPPKGSINKEISQKLKVPVITLESNMNEEYRERVDFHLYILNEVIKFYRLDR